MRFSLTGIKAITTGTSYIEESSKGITFHRFTKEEEELYKGYCDRYYVRAFATSGVKLAFKTDSKSLYIKANMSESSSRKYFSFDLFVNGEYKDSLNNFKGVDLPQSYTTVDLPLGDFEKTFDLGEGEKSVVLYFPWSVKVELEEISLDDNSFVIPVKRDKKILMYGDSITHGYDALYSFNKYATRLANALDCDEYNKAIGGEVFFPNLAKVKQPFTPELITVAYGTNDWSTTQKSTFNKNCKAFYENLSANYPDTPIFALAPIWRKEILTEVKPFGDFSLVEEGIREATKDLKNVTVIRGFDFVPKEEKYFADLRLHPNDKGFEYYAQNLYKMIVG